MVLSFTTATDPIYEEVLQIGANLGEKRKLHSQNIREIGFNAHALASAYANFFVAGLRA